MRLTNKSGDYLELGVLGYQFGDAEDDFDRNWLVIEGRVRLGEREWSFRHPCLLTEEAVEIVSWLETIADLGSGKLNLAAVIEASVRAENIEPERRLDFMEPLLAFEIAQPKREPIELVVELNHEARPVPEFPLKDTFEPETLRFELTTVQLREAAKDLRKNLYPFPPR